jgi:hypothetical protein
MDGRMRPGDGPAVGRAGRSVRTRGKPDARAREMQNLMVQQSIAERQAQEAQMAQLAEAVKKLEGAIDDIGENQLGISNAFFNSPGGGITNTLGFGLTLPVNFGSRLESLAGSPGTYGKVSPVVVMPLSSLHTDLADFSLDFDDSKFAGPLAVVRGFLLLVVTTGFLIMSFKMVSKAGTL